MYKVVGRPAGGVRYGVKERDGIYISDREDAATAFENRSEAKEFADILSEIHENIGLRFEAKENAPGAGTPRA